MRQPIWSYEFIRWILEYWIHPSWQCRHSRWNAHEVFIINRNLLFDGKTGRFRLNLRSSQWPCMTLCDLSQGPRGVEYRPCNRQTWGQWYSPLTLDINCHIDAHFDNSYSRTNWIFVWKLIKTVGSTPIIPESSLHTMGQSRIGFWYLWGKPHIENCLWLH